jgi:protoheme IX farnesyltransferase
MSSEATAIPIRINWRDYYEMCKPNVVLLMLLTSLVGMFMAIPGMVPWPIIIWGNLGIAMAAGSAAAVNHVIDRRIDGQMGRTSNRPVAKGKVKPLHALIFAAILAVIGLGILYVLVNPMTAWLTLASSIGYAFVYTGYLKRATPQNIVIGGLAGAMPPLLGWVAVTGTLDPNALLLVLLIYAWTPPHFISEMNTPRLKFPCYR